LVLIWSRKSCISGNRPDQISLLLAHVLGSSFSYDHMDHLGAFIDCPIHFPSRLFATWFLTDCESTNDNAKRQPMCLFFRSFKFTSVPVSCNKPRFPPHIIPADITSLRNSNQVLPLCSFHTFVTTTISSKHSFVILKPSLTTELGIARLCPPSPCLFASPFAFALPTIPLLSSSFP